MQQMHLQARFNSATQRCAGCSSNSHNVLRQPRQLVAAAGPQQQSHHLHRQPAANAAALAAAAALVLQVCLPAQQACAAAVLPQQPNHHSSSSSRGDVQVVVQQQATAASWHPVLGDLGLTAAAPEVADDMTLQDIEDDIMNDVALPPELKDFMVMMQKVGVKQNICQAGEAWPAWSRKGWLGGAGIRSCLRCQERTSIACERACELGFHC